MLNDNAKAVIDKLQYIIDRFVKVKFYPTPRKIVNEPHVIEKQSDDTYISFFGEIVSDKEKYEVRVFKETTLEQSFPDFNEYTLVKTMPTKANECYVDRENNLIYFHSSQDTSEISITYYSIGIGMLSSALVYTHFDNNNKVIETLYSLTKKCQEELDRISTVTNAEQLKVELQSYIESLLELIRLYPNPGVVVAELTNLINQANESSLDLKTSIGEAERFLTEIKTGSNRFVEILPSSWEKTESGRYKFEYYHNLNTKNLVINTTEIINGIETNSQIDYEKPNDNKIIFYTSDNTIRAKAIMSASYYPGILGDKEIGVISADNLEDGVDKVVMTREDREAIKNYGKIINNHSSQLEQKANLIDVAKISSGTPLFASSIAEMSDITKNYVNTTDMYVYIYRGGSWVNSNVLYQGTGADVKSIDDSNIIKTNILKLTDTLLSNTDFGKYLNADITKDNNCIKVICNKNGQFGIKTKNDLSYLFDIINIGNTINIEFEYLSNVDFGIYTTSTTNWNYHGRIKANAEFTKYNKSIVLGEDFFINQKEKTILICTIPNEVVEVGVSKIEIKNINITCSNIEKPNILKKYDEENYNKIKNDFSKGNFLTNNSIKNNYIESITLDKLDNTIFNTKHCVSNETSNYNYSEINDEIIVTSLKNSQQFGLKTPNYIAPKTSINSNKIYLDFYIKSTNKTQVFYKTNSGFIAISEPILASNEYVRKSINFVITQEFADSIEPYIYICTTAGSSSDSVVESVSNISIKNFTMANDIKSKALETLFENQKRDLILENYNYLKMFKKMGGIGDSLMSGEHVYFDTEGVKHYDDLYDFSWLSHLSKESNSECVHYSNGGLTCKNWLNKHRAKLEGEEVKCNAYFIGLGTNDYGTKPYGLGTISDSIGTESFVGYYKQIIELVHSVAPKSKIFLVGVYISTNTSILYNDMIREISKLYDYCYFIDLLAKSDVLLSDLDFMSYSHFNTLGYIRLAKNIERIANEIIVENIADFSLVGVDSK